MIRQNFGLIDYRVTTLATLVLLVVFCGVGEAQSVPAGGSEPSATRAASTGTAGETRPGANASTSRRDYRIGPGDVLQVDVAGEPEMRRKVKVMEQGTIRLPFIDRDLTVAGLSEIEVAALLRESYLSVLKDPQVTIFVEEYNARMASIAGAVNQPKQVALTREIRLYDLISLAGGVSDKAGTIAQLIHTRPEDSLETIDLRDLIRRPELNRVIRDGDFVNIPEVGIFYVTGNVNRPGSFPLKESVKLTQAIAMAGGMMADSKKREVRLVRATDASQTVTTEEVIDLLEIERNPTKDPLLRPYDVVMVPESTRAKQTKTLLQAFSGGLASALGWGIFR
ncbi:MAG: polysaccharide biosynthesis/export family protein [Blastocatellia bacterium]